MPRLRLDPFSPTGVSVVAEPQKLRQPTGYVSNKATGLITAGSNVTITGAGTAESPYSISAGDMDVAATWGNITGTITNQTDLNTALAAKSSKAFAVAMAAAL